VQVSPRLAGLLVGRGDTAPAEEGETGELEGHVVVVGFGLAGRNLARVLRARDVPYLAIDANPSSVREARSRKEPVIYGDASRRAVLARLGVARARLVVVAISDPLATRETVRVAHALAPGVPIVARTRYVLEVDPLEQAGAKVVVAEEYESTLEVVAEVLRHFGVPEGSIGRFTAGLREEGYELLRAPPAMILDPWLSELIEEVATEWVEVPDMFHGERSLAELGVRARTGVNVVAVERDGVTIPNPPPGFELHAGDRLLCMGVTAELQELEELLAREALS
jgi:CPA2 family monovalent cation:H+ antiporter-2